MNYIDTLKLSLREISDSPFEILAVHSYNDRIDITPFRISKNFFLNTNLSLGNNISVLCFYSSDFILLTLSFNGQILDEYSGLVDDEIVLTFFGIERSEVNI